MPAKCRERCSKTRACPQDRRKAIPCSLLESNPLLKTRNVGSQLVGRTRRSPASSGILSGYFLQLPSSQGEKNILESRISHREPRECEPLFVRAAEQGRQSEMGR